MPKPSQSLTIAFSHHKTGLFLDIDWMVLEGADKWTPPDNRSIRLETTSICHSKGYEQMLEKSHGCWKSFSWEINTGHIRNSNKRQILICFLCDDSLHFYALLFQAVCNTVWADVLSRATPHCLRYSWEEEKVKKPVNNLTVGTVRKKKKRSGVIKTIEVCL